MRNSFASLWQEVTAGKLARHTPVLLLAVLVLAIPLTVYIAGKQQQLQQHAAGTFNCTLYPDAVAFDPNNQNMKDGGCNGSNYCVRYDVSYSGSPAQPVSQSWYFGDGKTGINHYSTTSITHHGYPFPSSGSKQYSVRLSATDKNGVVGQDCTKTITVLPNSGTAGAAPTNLSYGISPTSVDLASNPPSSISLRYLGHSGTVTGYRVFVYHSVNGSQPTPGQGATVAYNPTIQDNTITYANSQPSLSLSAIPTPTKEGTYYIMFNAYNGNLVCDWNGQVYDLSQNQTPPNSIGHCSTTGRITLTVSGSPSPAGPGSQCGGLGCPDIKSVTLGTTQVPENSTTPVSISVSKGLSDYLVYIHGPGPLKNTDPVKQTYDQSNVAAGTFYFVGKNITSFLPPTTAPQTGTYSIVVNGATYNNTYTCSWDGYIYQRNADNSVTQTSQTCQNPGAQTFTVGSGSSSISVDSITLNPSQGAYLPGQANVTIAATGQGGSMGLYLFRSSDGNPPDSTKGLSYVPSSSPYSGGSITTDQMYLLNASNGQTAQTTMTLPPDEGTYYLVANAHSQPVNSWWASGDTVCTWMGQIGTGSTNNIQLGSSCSNASPVAFTISSSAGNPPGGNPSGGNPSGGNPGGGGGGGGAGGIICQILKFLCPTPTVTPTPTTALTPTTGPTSGTTGTPTDTGTPTSAPATPLQFMIYLHGIGSAGDNANPDNSSLSNKSPNDPNRTLTVTLFDTNNQQVAQTTGTISYNSADGDFTGTAGFGTNVPSGTYIVKVKTDQYLTRRIDGIQTITANQSNNMPSATLVAGDTNGDDVLDALDYNIILGCYSDIEPPVACDSSTGWEADLNDDGVVNQSDYNLFIRELSVKNGD